MVGGVNIPGDSPHRSSTILLLTVIPTSRSAPRISGENSWISLPGVELSPAPRIICKKRRFSCGSSTFPFSSFTNKVLSTKIMVSLALYSRLKRSYASTAFAMGPSTPAVIFTPFTPFTSARLTVGDLYRPNRGRSTLGIICSSGMSFQAGT